MTDVWDEIAKKLGNDQVQTAINDAIVILQKDMPDRYTIIQGLLCEDADMVILR